MSKAKYTPQQIAEAILFPGTSDIPIGTISSYKTLVKKLHIGNDMPVNRLRRVREISTCLDKMKRGYIKSSPLEDKLTHQGINGVNPQPSLSKALAKFEEGQNDLLSALEFVGEKYSKLIAENSQLKKQLAEYQNNKTFASKLSGFAEKFRL